MLQRVKQLWAALTAEISDSDKKYIRQLLEPDLQELFFAMTVGDQAHALRVARTAEELAGEKGMAVNLKLLKRCALLHDIGRGAEAGTPFAKTMAVLLKKYAAVWCERQAKLKPEDLQGYWQRIIWRHHHHAGLGAEILSSLGAVKEAEVIALHHSKEQAGEIAELKLLRLADEMN